ncbi:MAG: AAA family ATPase [Gloeomargaritaceae cyanobacterium C42_A2020_066]|nr:AAA family ATPase [Gloeomargaritaceae cyanobacterium C42_A2020_066]
MNGRPTRVPDLKTLILSFHPLIVMETVEEDRVQTLLQAVATSIPIALFEWSVTRGLIRSPCTVGRALHGTNEPLTALQNMAEYTVEGIFWLQDFAHHLQEPVVARQMRELVRKFAQNRSTVILTGYQVDLPRELSSLAVYYEFPLPTLEELRDLVKTVVSSLAAGRSIQVDLQPWEIQDLLHALSGMTLVQARQVLAYTILEDGRLSSSDIANILKRKAQVIHEGGLLEYYPVAENHYELGGFDRLKAWLARAKVGFTPAAQSLNLSPPKGILLLGVQGCGKSLAAKVIAREWRLPLLKLDAGRLYDKYIGESEKNLRLAITLAESMAPCVLWLDELEKAMAQGQSGDGETGVSRRLLGSFLTWLQEKRSQVFVVATANDWSTLPPELLRKGRFDEIFMVDLPNPAERQMIWEIHLKSHTQDPQALDLPQLVDASEGFSGAEIEQVIIGALYQSLYRKQALDTELLLQEIGQTLPLSVSHREDLAHLRALAQGRFISVN